MVVQRRERSDVALKPTATTRDHDAFEQTLRPRRLQEYIGQGDIKEHILVHVQAARTREEPLGHTLLHGPPGLGKTTLAFILAQEMGCNLKIASGPGIEKPGDLASLLTNLDHGDILFIDEIHRMRPAIEEVLYSAMEDFAIDLVIGKGPTARSMRLDLKAFTLVGATTKIGSMSAPLRDRFVHQFKLAFYSHVEMRQIVDRTARILGVTLDAGVSERIASSARATPRIANRLVRSIRDFAQVAKEQCVSLMRVESTLGALGIDIRGLDRTDRAILSSIIEKFGGGPVGLSTLSAVTSEEEETLEDVYEPYLLQQGLLQRTAKGRIVTPSAYGALGMECPEPVQRGML